MLSSPASAVVRREWKQLMFFCVASPRSGQVGNFNATFSEWVSQLAKGHRIPLPATVLAVCLPLGEAQKLQRSHGVETKLVPLDKALALAKELTYLLYKVVGFLQNTLIVDIHFKQDKDVDDELVESLM